MQTRSVFTAFIYIEGSHIPTSPESVTQMDCSRLPQKQLFNTNLAVSKLCPSALLEAYIWGTI